MTGADQTARREGGDVSRVRTWPRRAKRVSRRWQTIATGHRWGIDEGGEIGFIDLGDAALIIPGGVSAARHELRRVLADRYEIGVAALEDPDLVDQ